MWSLSGVHSVGKVGASKYHVFVDLPCRVSRLHLPHRHLLQGEIFLMRYLQLFLWVFPLSSTPKEKTKENCFVGRRFLCTYPIINGGRFTMAGFTEI